MHSETHEKERAQRSRYELVRAASALLRQNGFSIRGRPLEIEDWQQYQFEARMQLGAYCGKNAGRR